MVSSLTIKVCLAVCLISVMMQTEARILPGSIAMMRKQRSSEPAQYADLEDMPEGRVPCRGLCMFMRLEAMLKEMKEMAAAATNKEKRFDGYLYDFV